MSGKKTSAKQIHPEASVEEVKDWLTAEEFTKIEGMPGTARGARMRLEKLASLHPEIRRKRTAGKGVVYHISAATMSLDDERNRVKGDAFTLADSDRKLSLWIQLFRNMSPASRAQLMEQALRLVKDDLMSQGPDVSELAVQIMKLPEDERKRLLEKLNRKI
ncbi:hypothetical protein OD305_001364 [Salmonella enterica]|nr:hypothetical protein [Salmonella enterica]EJX3109211.1 hypothetical protein [Salmonella enterica]EJX3600749.1 hypothetical protein [Salmonella enterica]EKQ0890234.1 hypothetical protein [Salmonella enterica]